MTAFIVGVVDGLLIAIVALVLIILDQMEKK